MVTLDTFQVLISWLNAAASANIVFILVIEDTFQVFMFDGEFKKEHSKNILAILVTPDKLGVSVVLIRKATLLHP